MFKEIGRCFPTISVILSVISIMWGCGVSHVETHEASASDAVREVEVQSASNLAETDPNNERWGTEIERNFQKTTYTEIQDAMRPGDVIAFSGGTFASRLVMAITDSNVSHVGLVVPPTILDPSPDEPVIAEVNEKGVIFSPIREVIQSEVAVLWWLPLAERPAPRAVAEAVATHKQKSYDYQQATWLVLAPLAPVFVDADPQLKADMSRILSDMLVPPLREKLLAEVPEGAIGQMMADAVSESQLRGVVSEVLDAHLDTTRLFDPYVARLQNQQDTRKLFCSEFVADVFVTLGVIQDIVASQTTPIELCLLKGIYTNRYVQFKGATTQIRAVKQKR